MSLALVISVSILLLVSSVAPFPSVDSDLSTPDRQCSQNEELHKCAAAVCRAQSCDHLGIPVACPAVSRCDAACVCVEGTLRNEEGICVPEKECPGVKACPENEEFSMCTEVLYRVQTCVQKGQPAPWVDRTNDDPCTKSCVCVRDTLRDSSGKCIPEEQC